MTTAILFILAGYLCGGVLFARLAADHFGKTAITQASADGNPGTANAFTYGGFWCGVAVLCGDLAKGFLPVYLYLHHAGAADQGPLLLALALSAPVVGHAFPLFYRFQGGKGIAVTFGSLLGLVPNWRPALTLAFTFIFFSLVVCVGPHSHRTAVTYLCAAALMVRHVEPGVLLGFLMMTAVVLLRLYTSKEARHKPEVKLLWRS